MTTLSRWRVYNRLGKVQARGHVFGEDMTEIRVDDKYKQSVKFEGGYILRDPANTKAQWYVSKSDFDAGFDQEEIC